MSRDFKIESPFAPAGDQPQAIKELCEGIANGEKIRFCSALPAAEKLLPWPKSLNRANVRP